MRGGWCGAYRGVRHAASGQDYETCLSAWTVLNAVLIGLFFYASAKRPWLPPLLLLRRVRAGHQPRIHRHHGGDVAAAADRRAGGLGLFRSFASMHPMWASVMRLSQTETQIPQRHRRTGAGHLRHHRRHAAVQEEEKLELSYIDRSSGSAAHRRCSKTRCRRWSISLARCDRGSAARSYAQWRVRRRSVIVAVSSEPLASPAMTGGRIRRSSTFRKRFSCAIGA